MHAQKPGGRFELGEQAGVAKVVRLGGEEHRPHHRWRPGLAGQGVLEHLRRALGDGAGVGAGRAVRRQVDERRREERVELRPVGGRGQAVGDLDRRAGARRRAAPVAQGQRLDRRAQHLDLGPERRQEGGEERQRVEKVVRLRQADAAAGQRAGRRIGNALGHEGRQQLVALTVRAGGVLGQLGAHLGTVVVLGAVAAAHHAAAFAGHLDDRRLEPAEVGAVAVAAAAALALDHARRREDVEVDRGQIGGARGALSARGDRGRCGERGAGPVGGCAGRSAACLRGEQGDAQGAHGARVGRHHDLATSDRGQRARQRGVRGRLALKEDALLEAAVAHHAADVVLDHRVLQPGEDVGPREAVGQRLGGDVGDEHGTGLAEVGRIVGAGREGPKPGDVVEPEGEGLLLEERARAGAADAVHVGFGHASVTHVDELGVLPADLDDREAAAAVGVEAHGGGGVRHDLIEHGEAGRKAGVGGPHDGRHGVAPRPGQADRDHRVARPRRAQVGHQALGRFDRVAVGAPVHVGQHGARARFDQHTFRARRTQVEAQHGRRGGRSGARRSVIRRSGAWRGDVRRGGARRSAGRCVGAWRGRRGPAGRPVIAELHDRARTVGRRSEGAHPDAALDHQVFGRGRPLGAAPVARGGELQRAERLERAGLRRDLDGRRDELVEGGDERTDQCAVADQHDRAVDFCTVVERVHVTRHALEQSTKEAAVVLALISEVRELALGKDGAARGDGDAAVGRGGEGDGLLEAASEPATQALDGLAGARRAALVALVVDAARSVAREHRVAAAADAHHGQGALGAVEGARRPLLRDLFGDAAERGRRQAVAKGPRRHDARDPRGAERAIQGEEGRQRLAVVARGARALDREDAVGADATPGERRRDLAGVEPDEQARRTVGGRGRRGEGLHVRSLRRATAHRPPRPILETRPEWEAGST